MNKGISPKYNCSKCHESNISYKLYGMPAANTLKELESFGVNVEIMGCVTPYTGVKTYLFQCKNCKHEWFEYKEIKENYFEFLYENYPGPPSPKIIYESGFIQLEQGDGFLYIRVPNEQETENFWRKIDEFDVWSWKNKYVNNSVLDGFGWDLKIKKFGKKEKKICGYNSYPRNKHFFNKFLHCMTDFIDIDFIN